MSDSWDEKHDRNKGIAKAAFDEKATEREAQFSEHMRAALDGLNDRREGPADRRQHDVHAEARKKRTMDGRTALEVLKGERAPEREKDDKPPEKERPAPPPPSFALGGTQSRPTSPPREELERERERENKMEPERLREALARALLRESRERDRGRER